MGIFIEPEIIRQINDADARFNGIFFQEPGGFAMAQAKEKQIDVTVDVSGKYDVCSAEKVLVYIVQGIACIALAVHKGNRSVGVYKKQSNQFTARIACPADDADPDLVVHGFEFNLFYSRFAQRSK